MYSLSQIKPRNPKIPLTTHTISNFQIRCLNPIASYSQERIIKEPWHKQLWWCIIKQGVIQGDIGEIFTWKECIYNCSDILSQFRPNNNTIPHSISQTLQKLRDKRIIKFLDNKGSYKVEL